MGIGFQIGISDDNHYEMYSRIIRKNYHKWECRDWYERVKTDIYNYIRLSSFIGVRGRSFSLSKKRNGNY